MKGATGKIAPVPNRPNEAAAAVHGEPPSTHGCGLLEVASHTVAPAWTSIGAVGSARTRNVLRSWSPTARAARHVANSPKPRISDPGGNPCTRSAAEVDRRPDLYSTEPVFADIE